MRNRLIPSHERYANPRVLPINGRAGRWLERARRVAETVDGQWKIGCIIVRGGRVIASAANTQRNEPGVLGEQLWHCTVHAEIAALRMAGNAAGATAYIARVGRNGMLRHAQPCVNCQDELDKAGVRAVWTSDPHYVAKRQLLDRARN